MDGKLLAVNVRGEEDSGYTDLTGFLLKTNHGDLISPGIWWGMKNSEMWSVIK